LLVTAPQSLFSHLPIHAAMEYGMFDAEGLNIRVVDMETGNQHTNAVLSGQAFAFIGGPEHNAYANLKGAQLRAVVNMVDRNNNYLTARTGVHVDLNDLAGTFRHKTIAANFYGSTVNSTTRYICLKAGLKLPADVNLLEGTAGGALAAVQNGNADFAMISEPVLTKGIRAGIWQEPFWQGPKAFGSYAYTVLNVSKQTIDQNPEAVAGFVRAVVKWLKFVNANHDKTLDLARKTFPAMSIDDIQVTLKRCFADQLWSQDGQITENSWKNAEQVVFTAGLLKQEVPYSSVVDMQFVKA
jgi:NitT/TauT family transport system substrate-binding protein